MAVTRAVKTFFTFAKSFPRFLIDLVLHTPSSVKSIVLLTLLILCSLVYSFELVKPQYFGNKGNFLNRNFAKLGWGWTLLCVLPVTMVTSSLYSDFRLMMMARHLSRIAVAHAIFLGVTTVIALSSTLLLSFGHCSSSQYMNEAECSSNGEKWIELDISGHTFLLAYCIFVITEECKLVKPGVWESYKNATLMQANNGEELSRNKFLHIFVSPMITLLEAAACIEVFLMGNLFIATQMYYHTFFEKILGYLLAVVCWIATYQIWYGRWYYGPCAVHEGNCNPMNSSHSRTPATMKQ